MENWVCAILERFFRNKSRANVPCNSLMSVGWSETARHFSGNTSRKPSLCFKVLSTKLSAKFTCSASLLRSVIVRERVAFFTWSKNSSDVRWTFGMREKGGGGEKEGRSPQWSLWVRNRWGWAASQQLFPVFISLFQPLAFWWDVRGGAFVCMGCGGCGEIIPLVSGQVIKLSLPSYRGMVVQLMVRDWYFYTHQTTNSTQ